jgi:subtilisin family serine protease
MAVPDLVYAHASPVSIGGVSLFDMGEIITQKTVQAVTSPPNVVRAAAAQLSSTGFIVLSATDRSINFAGPPDLFEKAFRTKIVEREIPLPRGATATHLTSPDTDTLGLIPTAGTPFADVIEGVALERPRYFLSESPIPPTADYWHLRVPGDVATASNAAQIHQFGITGQGLRIAMVDSGWYRHEFFRAQGYNVAPVVLAPAATDPDADESGHGTGESANILAIAPGCQLLPVKMNFVNTTAAFDTAVGLKPDIITCSWGSDLVELGAADMVLGASVAAAVASGITVIFSAGNGHVGFPGQHPDVISAGGVFMDTDGSLQASNYASAFSSPIYPGREVPDVCGLVGMRPKAIYIMLPVQPGDNIDVGNSNSGSPFPDGDQTPADDGWAAFSGTSAAAPQLAGIAALIKQVAPNITPALLKAVLAYSARTVVNGTSSPTRITPLGGLSPGSGPGQAPGIVLADAYSAVLTAYYAVGAGALAAGVSQDPLAAAYLQGMFDAATAINAAMYA